MSVPGDMMLGREAFADLPMPVAGNVEQSQRAELERREVDRWLSRIRHAQSVEKAQFDAWIAWRKTLAGDGPAGVFPNVAPDGTILAQPGADGGAKTNIIYATFAAELPRTYDSTPQYMCSPVPAVDDLHYEYARAFAETATIVLNRHLVSLGNLEERMEESVRAVFPTGHAWLKVGYYRDRKQEIQFQSRRPDAQNELAMLQHLTELLREASTPDEQAALAIRIQELHSLLFRQVEVVSREGVGVDRVAPTDIVVALPVRSIGEGYLQAPWIAQRLWTPLAEAAAAHQLTPEEVKRVSHYQPVSLPGGAGPPEGMMAMPSEQGGVADSDMRAREGAYCARWEIWDRDTHSIRTCIEGLRRYASAPWQPERRPERWYPFYYLSFNKIPDRRYDLSDVELLAPLQDEFHNRRRQYKDHREATIPKTAIDAGKITPQDAAKYRDAPAGSTVSLEGAQLAPNQRLEEAFFVPSYAPPDPSLYDTGTIWQDIQTVSGMGDAQRGAVMRSKTATEARLVEGGVQSRLGQRKKETRRVEEEIGRDTLEVLLQELPLHAVQRIAGGAAVWPQIGREQIQDLATIQVMHLSAEDREERLQKWMSIAPLIQEALPIVMQFRAQGLEVAARPYVELLKETLHRMDERLSVERFLPGGTIDPSMALPPQLQLQAAVEVFPPALMLGLVRGGGGAPAPGPAGPSIGVGPPGQPSPGGMPGVMGAGPGGPAATGAGSGSGLVR